MQCGLGEDKVYMLPMLLKRSVCYKTTHHPSAWGVSNLLLSFSPRDSSANVR
jgi:hypothetical protein